MKFQAIFLFDNIMFTVPMIAYHPKNIRNFVDKTEKQEILKETSSQEFPKPGHGFQTLVHFNFFFLCCMCTILSR